MRTKCRTPTTRSSYTRPYQILTVITVHGFLVNPSTDNEEQGDRKGGLFIPFYTPERENNKFCYTVGQTGSSTVPLTAQIHKELTRLTLNPMPEHNLDLLVAFHTSRQGYKDKPRKREHKKTLPQTSKLEGGDLN